jgi:hypothetical protein
MFGPMMWELLNIEYFCQRNNKRKTKNLREIGVHSWYCQKKTLMSGISWR